MMNPSVSCALDFVDGCCSCHSCCPLAPGTMTKAAPHFARCSRYSVGVGVALAKIHINHMFVSFFVCLVNGVIIVIAAWDTLPLGRWWRCSRNPWLPPNNRLGCEYGSHGDEHHGSALSISDTTSGSGLDLRWCLCKGRKSSQLQH